MQSFTVWGIVLINKQKEMTGLQEIEGGETTLKVIESMALLRMLPLFCWGILCFILTCMLMCTLVSGGRQLIESLRERTLEQEAANNLVKRLPIISKFLMQKSRKYDPEKDKEVESCPICMVEFRVNDPELIAELNCSHKHIFHLKCIKEWVKTKDNCPMCREQIAGEFSKEITQHTET